MCEDVEKWNEHVELKSSWKEFRSSLCFLGTGQSLIIPSLLQATVSIIHSLIYLFICLLIHCFVHLYTHPLLNVYYVLTIFYDWKYSVELYLWVSESAPPTGSRWSWDRDMYVNTGATIMCYGCPVGRIVCFLAEGQLSWVLQEEKQLALKTEEGCFNQREVGKSLEFWLLPGVCGWFEVGREDGKGGSQPGSQIRMFCSQRRTIPEVCQQGQGQLHLQKEINIDCWQASQGSAVQPAMDPCLWFFRKAVGRLHIRTAVFAHQGVSVSQGCCVQSVS